VDAVDLDGDEVVGPVEVDLAAEQVHIDVGLRKVEAQERVLRTAPRPRASHAVEFHRPLEHGELVPAVHSRRDIPDRRLHVPSAVRGLVDDVGQLVRRQDVGKIDEQAVHRRDGDAVELGEVARIERPAVMDTRSCDPAPARRDDLDQGRRKARDAVALRRRQAVHA